MEKLPVEFLEDEILEKIESGVNRFLISAPTASGKSTKLPQIFAKSKKLEKSIIVLEPRRIATTFLAKTVAKQRNTKVGDEVGWHIRFDKKYGKDTKIIFATEGILLRQMLSDKNLHNVSAIILDEFHERNLYSDLSLALAVKLQESTRPDLVIAVCSASMNESALENYFGSENSARLSCSSRLHDVEISYSPSKNAQDKIWDRTAREFHRLAQSTNEGNFLIFMSGIYEINRTIRAILSLPSSKNMLVLPLYGNMPLDKQEEILSNNSKRKVIVSTNVAETSLTIEGVKFVIDSGYAKIARYDSLRGINTLLTERISHANALQRSGRAGRTSKGYAVRMWSQKEEEFFAEFIPSEISRVDLSQHILALKSANIELSQLRFLEEPSQKNIAHSISNLKSLGAIDEDGNITEEGRLLAQFPLETKYAKLLLESTKRNCLECVALIAGIIESGRIKLDVDNKYKEEERASWLLDETSEVGEIIALCEIARQNKFNEAFCREYGIHLGNVRKVYMNASQLVDIARRISPVSHSYNNPDDIAKCVLSAFSQHLCVRSSQMNLNCKLQNNRSAKIDKKSKKYAKEYFCALFLQEQSLGANGVDVIASMCVPIDIEAIREIFPNDLVESSDSQYDPKLKKVIEKRYLKFRDLVLSDSTSDSKDKEASAQILQDEILKGNILLKNNNDSVKEFINRANFVAKNCPDYNLSTIDDEAMKLIFANMCYGKNSYSQLRDMEVLPYVKELYSREELNLMDYLAPKYITVNPKRKGVKVEYNLELNRATLPASFKDLYDFDENKVKILDGKLKITYEILAPNNRAIQTTQELSKFWLTSWKSIRKEVKNRYPKHFKSDEDFA
ncbi:MAG: ATP-dependent helicase C-terminal domain-containing protein [Opitutales bacterium]